jgi:hypothetical protein
VITPPNQRPPNQGITILLYIAGVALVITAIILVLRGSGLLPQIPGVSDLGNRSVYDWCRYPGWY